MKHLVLVIFLLETFFVFSCKSLDSSHKEEKYIPMKMIENITYRILQENYYSNPAHSSQGVYVARSLEEAIAISEGNEYVVDMCKEVDFSKEAVLFAFAGRFNTGGYSVKLNSIKRESQKKVTVLFSVSSPKMGEIVTQALTSPSIIVAIKADKEDIIESSFGN